jgi:chorismate mutase/prephenate dehydratase
MNDLDRLREALDGIDRKLIEVLRERLETVAGIARIKAEGLPFLRDHDREAELLDRIEGWARELGIDQYRTQEIFREIIAMSLKAQEEQLLKREQVERSARSAMRVAYQGQEGSYSHIAGRKYFSTRAEQIEFVGLSTFDAALVAAEEGSAPS